MCVAVRLQHRLNSLTLCQDTTLQRHILQDCNTRCTCAAVCLHHRRNTLKICQHTTLQCNTLCCCATHRDAVC